MQYTSLLQSLLNIGVGIYTQLAVEDTKRGVRNQVELNLGYKVGKGISECREEERVRTLDQTERQLDKLKSDLAALNQRIDKY